MDRLLTTFYGHGSWVQALHFQVRSDAFFRCTSLCGCRSQDDWLITGAFDGALIRWDLRYLMKMCSRDVNKWAVGSLSFDRSKLITGACPLEGVAHRLTPL